MKKKIIIGGIIILAVVILIFMFVGQFINIVSKEFSATNYSDTKPMYGALNYEDYIANRSPELKKADDYFVKEIIATDGSSKAAFKDGILLAISYLSKKDTDTAMKRCNEAWLIDNTNFNVSWCYGLVLDSTKNFEQAAFYFEKALTGYSTSTELYTNDYLPLYRDASQTFIHLSNKYSKSNSIEAKKYAAKAITLLLKSIEDKNLPKKQIPVETFMLSLAYFINGSYSDARIYMNKLNAYPEYTKSDEVVMFNEALKNKGF